MIGNKPWWNYPNATPLVIPDKTLEDQNALRIEALCDRAGLTTDETFDLLIDPQLRSVLLYVEDDASSANAEKAVAHFAHSMISARFVEEKCNHALGMLDAAVLILPGHADALARVHAYVGRL